MVKEAQRILSLSTFSFNVVRKFLSHILIIVLGVLLFNLVYVGLIGGYLRIYADKYLNFPAKISLLILGDSHPNLAWVSNPDGAAYNFSQGSDNIVDMRKKFEYATVHNGEEGKKALVLSFESHLIAPYRALKQNNRLNDLLNHPYLDKRVVYAMPLIFDPTTEVDVQQYIGRLFKSPVDAENVFTKRRADGRLRHQFADGSVSRNLLREYQNLINDARKAGYEIIAIKYPLHPYYDSLVKRDPRSLKLTHAMDSLAGVNDLSITDFSDIIRDPALFRDPDHLNSKGSAVFVKEFAKAFFNRY